MVQAFIGNVGTCTAMLTEKSQVEDLHVIAIHDGLSATIINNHGIWIFFVIKLFL